MDYTKKTIFVRSKKAAHQPEYREVQAILVGGVEGVFAVWKEGNIVYLAAGDDGSWHEIACYHENWIPDILCALGAAS